MAGSRFCEGTLLVEVFFIALVTISTSSPSQPATNLAYSGRSEASRIFPINGAT